MKSSFYLIYAVLLFVLGSCKTIYYTPNAPNIPLLSQRGEIKAKVATGTYDFEPQLAFAITNHFALMTNASFSFADSSTKSLKRNFWEEAIGYYMPIDSKGAIFETYAGYGRGNVFGNYSYLDDKTNAWFDRFFIQPNIGIRSRYFEIGACIRFSAVNIHKTFPDKISSGYSYFIEPVASLRLGWQWVKLDLQFGFSGNLKKDDLDIYPHNPIIASVGLQFTIGGKKFEKY